jgi:BirA family transcriptional regulator, biotin operon repressor / biotin---[acetyl-CoA-carboxylase] ligase
MQTGQSYNLKRLREAVRPVRLHWFPRLGSTNDQAAAMRRRHELFAPALVLAGTQIAGRGRGSNRWWSSAGSVTATLVFPVQERFLPHQLPLIIGLALRNAAAGITGNQEIELKWPNDLVYRGQKVAGLLCERVQRADLIGIGLNVNLAPATVPTQLREKIVSLSQIAGRSFDKTGVLSEIVRQLLPVLSRRDEYPFPAVLREYDRHHALRGRRVSVTVSHDIRPIEGTCQGLDGLGRLLVRDQSNEFHIVTGQVQVR